MINVVQGLPRIAKDGMVNASSHNYSLILASASPRRRELLRQAGIAFEAVAADISEVRREHEPAVDYCSRLAREKAHFVLERLNSEKVNSGQLRLNLSPEETKPSPTDLLVLGADTIVVLQEEVMGKPRDHQEAMVMLRKLSGRTHEVMTAICLLATAPLPIKATSASKVTEHTALEITKVVMSAFSEEEILNYVKGGEPMDKAGAYAIQGAASKWIPSIEGCYFNVVGLPVAALWGLLQKLQTAC